LTGGLIYTYLAGTTTPANTYTQSNGISAHPNPIVLNAAGRVPDSGEIWLSDGISYKFLLKDSNGVQIATYDNISGINSNFVAYSSESETQTATQGQTVFTLASIQYLPATNNLAVYVNGSKQIDPTNYVETDSTTVTFVSGLNVGDIVEFSTATPVASNVVDAANVGYNQGGTGAVNRNVESKLQEYVSVNDFGAVGDGSTDDSAAIQKAIDYCRSFAASGTLPTLKFGEDGDTKTYLVLSTLDMTQIRAYQWIVDLNGSTIHGKTSGSPVIDALDSQFISIRNGGIFGFSGAYTPNIGIQMGRGLVGNDAANSSLYNFEFTGNYTYASFLNAGCEVFIAEKCLFWNGDSTAGAGHCLVEDSNNTSNVNSQFFTVNVPVGVQQSLNDNLYLGCTFEQISLVGATGGAAIYVPSNTNALRFNTCYAQNSNNRVMDIGGDHSLFEFDCHCEPANVTSNIRVLCTSDTATFLGAKVKEYYSFATDGVITTDGGANLVSFINSEIEVSNANAVNAKIFTSNGGDIDFHGTLKIGTSGYLYDLSELNAIIGTIQCQDPISNFTFPFINNVIIQSYNDTKTQYTGKHLFSGSLLLDAGFPATIASAATISIPQNGFSFGVTGTTSITKINVNAGDAGRFVTLTFAGALTLTNGLSGNMVLAGNYSTQANYKITLYCDGTYWSEISRSNNVAA
jgi:hypothetical protein